MARTPKSPGAVVSTPAKYVQRLHFEDFSGNQFERLVFAYHARTERWLSLEWFGQQGKDKGRDILGRRVIDGHKDGELMCVLCANWRKMTLAKIKTDLDKVLKSPSGTPDRLRVVCGHDVAASLRDDAKAYASSKNIHSCEVWSGQEFEEHVRASAESLLARFVDGEEFPDTPQDLMTFACETEPLDDHEALVQLARVFDRPAFYTPIMQESSLPAFKQAITDSIKAIGTGVWQTREGQMLARLRSRHQFEDRAIRNGLAKVEKALAALRAAFDGHMQSGKIRPCGCNEPDCPVYMIDPDAAHDIEQRRRKVLDAFHAVYPEFDIQPGW